MLGPGVYCANNHVCKVFVAKLTGGKTYKLSGTGDEMLKKQGMLELHAFEIVNTGCQICDS
jgi:hypothetical protein